MPPPPGPHLPALVQRVRYLRDPLGYIADCQRRFGDVFQIRLVDRGMVFVCTPDLAKEVYTAPDDILAAGEAKIAIFGKILGTSSTLLLDGAPHLRRRRLMLPQFRGEIMQGFAPVMRAACERVLADTPRSRPFPLHPLLHRIAFDIIGEALFSATDAARRPRLLEILRTFAHRAVTSRLLMFPALQRDLGPLSPWGRVQRAVADARSAVLDEITHRRKGGALGDITGLLLSAKGDDGELLADNDVLEEILTMVAAGHETTAMAMTWACYAVYSRPEVLAQLRAEVRAGGDLDRMTFLEAVVRESLRYHSLIPNGSGRVVKKAFRLGGYDIPAGAMVTVAFEAIHRANTVYRQADQFRPERTLEAKFGPYEAVAFGGGTRRCLGMPFALFEIKLVLALLVDRYDLEIVQRRVLPSWRGAFLTPSKGLKVRLTPATAAAARA